LNFELLLKAVETAEELNIPSTFVETNRLWCDNDKVAREKLQNLVIPTCAPTAAPSPSSAGDPVSRPMSWLAAAALRQDASGGCLVCGRTPGRIERLLTCDQRGPGDEGLAKLVALLAN
jgi:hypothetical protein